MTNDLKERSVRSAISCRMPARCMALILGWLAGCAPTTPLFDRQFGDTVRIAVARQLVNPAAAANRNPVAGADGRSAQAALEQYQRSFSTPEPQNNLFTIGVSNGK